MFFVLNVAHGDPLFAQVGPKIVIFRGFSKTFPFQIPIKVFSINWIPQHISLEISKKTQSDSGDGAKFGPN